VVTDLDGCLLDAVTYDHRPALPVLATLRRRRVPVVFCTSKTRSEVGALFGALGASYLSIVEDGAGLLAPPGALAARLPGSRRTAHGRLLPLALAYPRVRRLFARLARETGGAVRGFGDMTADEIARLTDLPRPAAARAARREFDEPFVYVRRNRRVENQVRAFAARRGLRHSRGGRFDHLHGPTDKGAAVRLVRELLEKEYGRLTVLGLGDSPLDAPLLAESEIPVIVPKSDGKPDSALRRRFPGARIAPEPGSRGWARIVREVTEV
jgi:mannosyl-3-phosphoglycerate phosphatase family protein